jgi:hypothetical protein
MFGEHRLQSHLELRTVHFRDNFVTRKKLRDMFVIRCNIKWQSGLQAANRVFPVHSRQQRDNYVSEAAKPRDDRSSYLRQLCGDACRFRGYV